MDEEGKTYPKDSQSSSSDKASTIKRWNNRWTPSEVYDSSGTTSTSEPSEDYSEECHSSQFNLLNHHSQAYSFCKSQGCLCQSCLLGYARVIALQGSLPNICTAANISPLFNFALCNASSSSGSRYMPTNHESCNCCVSPQIKMPQQCDQKVPNSIETESNKTSGVNTHQRYVGSLDRRRKKMKNKIDRDQRTKSQSDLICCDKKNKPHHCSTQKFHCVHSHHTNNCASNTEERLRKLENERSALHMEISFLSEQVEVQSNKIIELEEALQEKKDSLRQLEESLQKEVLMRSTLETQKLELLSSLSEMKLRQASLEHENLSLRSTNSLTNSDRFSRHAGHYCSLPRPPNLAKKGVAFADEEKTYISDISNHSKTTISKPFEQLSIDEVGEWLQNLGLDSYTNELKRWGATGTKLLGVTQTQIDKELDIKNSLHKKKLYFAIESEKCNGTGFFGSEKMDNAAVLRWLDDIGLPQHKESFHNAKVDGRVLNRLTTEDLITLNVTAQLHVASLRRGIQVLRELNFDFDNLERRSLNENNYIQREGPLQNKVSLWTNHRVMEWLRVVDLAEYAPNMRGSGVHGGLMVYENRFTSELLATLLSIPPAKTLLRRHLTTHFNQIVGRDVVQQKREMENTLGFTPLTLTARIKVPKKTQFTLKRKKSKSEADFGHLVCPLEESPPGTPPTSKSSMGSPNLNSPTF